MTALSADRQTRERAGDQLELDVAASTTIFAGSLVALNSSGYAVPGSESASLQAIGRAEEYVDNSDGDAGDLTVKVKRGVFRFGNSAGGDAIAVDDIGKLCYMVDDQTVGLTSNSYARSPAGRVVDVDSSGVWVRVGDKGSDSAADLITGELAAARLPDIPFAKLPTGTGDDEVAIGDHDHDAVYAPIARPYYVTVRIPDLSGAASFFALSPVAGTITKVRSVIEGTVDVDTTLTPKIGGVAVADGALSITASGSAAGDVDEATPSDDNTVTAGGAIELACGGEGSTASAANVQLEITPA